LPGPECQAAEQGYHYRDLYIFHFVVFILVGAEINPCLFIFWDICPEPGMIRKNLQLLQLMEGLADNAALKGAITLRHFPVRHRLIQQDQKGELVYVIRSGITKCFITEENGKDFILEFLGEGEVLGELEAIRGQDAFSSVETVTPLSVFMMSRVQFLYLLRTQPELNAIILELLATRVANSAIRVARQQLYSLSELLPQLLSVLDSQGIQFTKQDLSEYLGISVRSLNRLLKEAGGLGAKTNS
jgi:CRP-like cAMP-binding protein